MPFKSLEPQPNFPKLEENILKFWQAEKIFEKSLENSKGKKHFVFFEGPPTANGRPGLHHVEARAFKDVILRYQTMRGRFVGRKAGWDTQGLPVEIEVEKTLKISGKRDIENLVPGDSRASIEKFNRLCRESVWKYKDEWEHFTNRMGFWLDLKQPYITYERNYIESVWAILKRLWDRQKNKQSLIYQGHKVLPYCPRCGTALSSHEVAQGYKSVEENSVYIKFKLRSDKIEARDGKGHKVVVKLDQPTYLLSWTTTPWTLPGNVALAVGEDIGYSIIKAQDCNYILASALLERVITGPFTVLEKVSGRDLVGLHYEPLFSFTPLAAPKAFRVYPADFVTVEDGTGIVHTAVMYGEDDYRLGTRLGLPKVHTVDESGRFVSGLGELSGREAKTPEAEKHLLHHLHKHRAIFRELPYRHDYPFCWRCGTPLLYYARDSWFVRVSALKDELLANNEQIIWVPEYIKHGRFGGWLSEIKDWAISRERYWGTPLPFWRCGSCKEYLCVGSVEELEQKALKGGQKFDSQKLDLHRPYVDEIKLKCEHCGEAMSRVPEVLDVWFDSGAMPYAQWHWPFENQEIFTKQFPADYISEAIDQTRGWFYTLLAVSTALGETRPPFRNVICLGHILDARGQKMSKSKGNVVVPEDLFSKYGADIVRWYMYSVNQPGSPKLFMEADLSRMQRRLQMILWNVSNYFITYANTRGWTFDPRISPAQSKDSERVLDKWINARLQQVVNEVTSNLEHYDVFRSARSLERLIDDLSTWYLRRSARPNGRRFFATLYRLLIYIVRLLAPFMPFLSEAIYLNLHHPDFPVSVHLHEWPQSKELTEGDRDQLAMMEQARKIAEAVLAFRKTRGLKVRQPLSELIVVQKSSELTPYLDLLAEELNFVNLSIAPTPPQDARFAKLESSTDEYVLYVDAELTPELLSKGLARDLERAVQELRRLSGLSVGERVELYYETSNQAVYDAFEYFDIGKTGIERVIGSRQSVDWQTNFDAGETGTVWLGLKRLEKKTPNINT
ncbi:MAG: isoleucine--tRNA ligase [Patescibacteria group bacterium]|nr:isoleucine--tRNA ligase [Patescibacteria group bacterium]